VKKHRKTIQNIATAAGMLLLLYQAWQAVEGFLVSGVRIDSPGLLLIALALIVITIAQQMAAWSILMRGIGVRIPWAVVPRGYILSFLPRYIPGTVWGYLSRGEWLYQDFATPYSVSNTGSLLEVLIAVLANVIVISLFFLPLEGANIAVVIAGLLCLLLAIWFVFNKSMMLPFLSKIFSFQFPKTRLSLTGWFACLGMITANMLLYGLALDLTLRAMNYGPASHNWLLLSATFCVSWLIGFLVFILPSGLGLRELTLSSLLILNFGLTFEEASVVSVLFRLVVTLAEVLWIIFVGWKPLISKLSRGQKLNPE